MKVLIDRAIAAFKSPAAKWVAFVGVMIFAVAREVVKNTPVWEQLILLLVSCSVLFGFAGFIQIRRNRQKNEQQQSKPRGTPFEPGVTVEDVAYAMEPMVRERIDGAMFKGFIYGVAATLFVLFGIPSLGASHFFGICAEICAFRVCKQVQTWHEVRWYGLWAFAGASILALVLSVF